ncbi:hypothetical protein CIT26_19990 [Mesorhizobium temperatum]|uniref:Uncharacterized protein n=1 Tax=Mesorhizobium temperatum TaxID=241416 RepID=A0A271LHN4_9HYPH|nr:hypothetical protein CIT26_19990 [Mesorhizobium temperatum]
MASFAVVITTQIYKLQNGGRVELSSFNTTTMGGFSSAAHAGQAAQSLEFHNPACDRDAWVVQLTD